MDEYESLSHSAWECKLTFRTSADAFPANFRRRARAGSGSALGEQFGVDEPLGFDLPVSQ
jgi:hypothetical protein